MANVTGFGTGRLAPTWAAAFNASELNSLASGNTVLSALTFANDGAGMFDQLVKISMKITLPSASTLVAGACITFWLAEQLDDLTNYGDGGLAAGSATAYTPPWEPICVMSAFPRSTATVWLSKSNLLLPPSTFSFVVQNSLGFSFATSGNTVKFLTNNINTNAG